MDSYTAASPHHHQSEQQFQQSNAFQYSVSDSHLRRGTSPPLQNQRQQQYLIEPSVELSNDHSYTYGKQYSPNRFSQLNDGPINDHCKTLSNSLISCLAAIDRTNLTNNSRSPPRTILGLGKNY